MCNCGKKRTEFKQQSTVQSKTVISKAQPVQQQSAGELFKYTGNTGLTITGSITRKNYRFHFSGDVQPIDSKDAYAMMGVPVLKRV